MTDHVTYHVQNRECGVEGEGEGKGGAEDCKMGRVEGRAAWWRTFDVCSTFDVVTGSILYFFHTNMAYLQVGNRGGKILVYNNFRYQKNQERASTIHWRCWQKTCRAPLQSNKFDDNAVNGNVEVHVISVGQHNHDNDTDLIEEGRLKQEMKQRIGDDPSKPVRRVYDEVVIDAPTNNIPSFDAVRSMLTRKRSSIIPAIPRRVQDVHIENEWQLTWGGEQFLQHQDEDWGLLIFATSDNLNKLRQCSDIYIDGTFKSCPRPYKQVLTIHGKFVNRVLLFVIALITGKTVAQYRQTLQFIKREVRAVTGHRWRPRRIVMDFEGSLLAAVETELPFSTPSGCYFHFCQSLWRRIQELGKI